MLLHVHICVSLELERIRANRQLGEFPDKVTNINRDDRKRLTLGFVIPIPACLWQWVGVGLRETWTQIFAEPFTR